MTRGRPIGHDLPVTDTPQPADEAPTGDEAWGVNAVIGAAAVATRTTIGVAEAVSATTPARAVAGATRWLTRPLSREGEEVREQFSEEAGPTATGVIRQVTPGVLGAIDINAILAAIDINALLANLDIGAILEKVDVDAIVGRVDVDGIVDRVDVDAIVGRVDISRILDQVDIGAIVDRIDLNALLEKVDLNLLLTRIDLNALLEDVDLNAVVQRLDMDALVANTELGSIIAQSTSGVASEALDAVRSQGVGLDNFIGRLANRVMRRDPEALPPGPPLLVQDQLALPAGEPDTTPGSTQDATTDGTVTDGTVTDGATAGTRPGAGGGR
jgi:hypothetical protein